MYKLLGSPKTRAARVMWMLEELGVDYEINPCGPQDPAVTAVSPTGKIPVLLDGDLAVTDSTAILLHLGDKEGKLTYPAGSPERARMMNAVMFAVDAFEQPLWANARHSFILPEELRAAEAIRPALQHDFDQAMAALEAMLGANQFIMGDEFTIPDIILGHNGGWAKMSGFGGGEGKVAEYMARVRGRPAWKAVTKAREG